MKIVKYLGLVGLAIFIYIIYSIGSVQIIESILALDSLLFALALLSLVPCIAVKAWRQSTLASVFGPKLGFCDSARIWLIGFFFSVISPGKSGNVVKSFYFKEMPGIPAAKGLSVVVVERFLDIAILLIFVMLALTGFSFYFIPVDGLLPSLLLMSAGLAFLALLLAKKNVAIFFARPFYWFLAKKSLGLKLKTGFHQFFEGIAAYKANKKAILKAALLTIASWLITITTCYVLALSLHINVSFAYLFMVIPIVNLLSILPIAFSGIGTREAALVFFLGLISIPASTAVSFSLLIFFMDLVLGFTGWLLMAWQKKPQFKRPFSQSKSN